MKKAYTVKELSDLSGVTIRTLHYYDEIGLLKPAYVGANGYRYYGEKELLLLQQIIHFRDLGFKLRKIKDLLGRSDLSIKLALSSHKKALLKDIERTRQLIEAIDDRRKEEK